MEEAAPQRPSRTAFAARFFNQLRQIKRLLLRYWWIPLLTFGASEGIQWMLLKRIAPEFVSVGKMIVNVKLSIPNANVYSEDVNNFFGTQTALMQSDSVINRVNARLRLAHPVLAPVPVDISVSLSPKSGIFNLRATGREADYTQAYLKATMDEVHQFEAGFAGQRLHRHADEHGGGTQADGRGAAKKQDRAAQLSIQQ